MKRICCLFAVLLTLSIVLAFSPQPAYAADTITITSPEEWTAYSWDDSMTARWNSVSGAAGYYVSIRNMNTDELLLENKYTTSPSMSIAKYFPESPCRVKLWVGAVDSSTKTPLETFATNTIYFYLSHEPDVTNGGSSSITETSATLEMTINYDYAYSIEDCGFYLGTSSSRSSMDRYSFFDYGSSTTATTKGTKYMTITGLEPGTKYYYRAWAENLIGEEYTGYKTFTTDEGNLPDPVITYPVDGDHYPGKSSIKLQWNAVSGVDGYRYHIKQLSGEPDRDNENEDYIDMWSSTVSSSRTYYTLSAENVIPGYWYKFVVEAYADGKDSGWSDWCYVYIDAGKLSKAVIVSPSNTGYYTGSQSIKLDWDAVSGADGYTWIIKRLSGLPDRTNENEPALATWSGTTSSGTTAYTLSSSKFIPGYWYKFVVEAHATGMDPSWSEWIYCYAEEPELEDPYISTPVSWDTLSENQSITIDWDAIAAADGYRCHIKRLIGKPDTSNNNEPAEKGWVEECGTTSKYTFASGNVIGGYWYKFVAEAYSATAGSAWSNWVYVYVPRSITLDRPVITAPVQSDVYEAGEDILFTWSSVPNATGYRYIIKELAGQPDYSNNEKATCTWSGTTGTVNRYYRLDGANVNGNKWYKFVVEASAPASSSSWSKYTYIYIPQKEEWVHYTHLPSVTVISENTYANNKLLRTYDAGDSRLETIGGKAFANCINMQSINLPATVTFISDTAFENCPQLKIHCPVGSYAESYANSHGIPVVTYGIAIEADNIQPSRTIWAIDSSDAAETAIEVDSSGKWTAASDKSWLKLSRTSGADGDNLILSAAKNTTYASRSATVTFTCGKATAIVKVTQGASASKACTMKLLTDYWEPAAGSLSREIFVQNESGFSVTSNKTWLSCTVADSIITAKVSSGALGTAQTGILTVTCDGCGASKTVTVAIKNSVVPTPTNVQASSGEPHAVTLVWNAVSGAGHIIERSSDGGSTWKQVVKLPVGTSTYTDGNSDAIGALTTYQYRITATKTINGQTVSSAPSAAVSVTTKAEAVLYFTGKLGTLGTTDNVNLSDITSASWTTLHDVSYQITVKNLTTNTYPLNKVNVGTSNTKSLSGLLAEGNQYKIWVGAYNKAGRLEGQTRSKTFSVSRPAPPKDLSNLIVINQNDHEKHEGDLIYVVPGTGEKKTVKSSGCGLCSIVNAIQYLKGYSPDVHTVVDFVKEKKQYKPGDGVYPTLYKLYADAHGADYGIRFIEKTTDMSKVKQYLAKGCAAIVGVRAPNQNNPKETDGHIIVVAAYNSATNKYLILDSAGTYKKWTNSKTDGKLYAWQSLTLKGDKYLFENNSSCWIPTDNNFHIYGLIGVDYE